MVGLGYLVSTEISLTVWLSYFAMRLAAVAGSAMGYPAGQLPYPQEQGIGAYLVLAVIVVWLSRRHLLRAWRFAINGRGRPGPEGIRFRWMFVGLVGGFAAVWGFATRAGMAGWVSFVYLVHRPGGGAGLRAPARGGRACRWSGCSPTTCRRASCSIRWARTRSWPAGRATLPVWALFTFLARGYFPAMTGYQIEGMELTRRANIDPKRVVWAVCLAVALGFAIGWYNHLTPYYKHGAQQLRGGIWGTWIAVPEYEQAAAVPAHPQAAGARPGVGDRRRGGGSGGASPCSACALPASRCTRWAT